MHRGTLNADRMSTRDDQVLFRLIDKLITFPKVVRALPALAARPRVLETLRNPAKGVSTFVVVVGGFFGVSAAGVDSGCEWLFGLAVDELGLFAAAALELVVFSGAHIAGCLLCLVYGCLVSWSRCLGNIKSGWSFASFFLAMGGKES